MRYEISIRVAFPEEIAGVIWGEKQRYINEYGSSYKSEPHITLYLESYTEDGYPKLLNELRELHAEPFTVSLLMPEIRIEESRHRNLYVMEVSHKEKLNELHRRIAEIADQYRSPFIREKMIKRLEREGIHTDGTRESFKKLHFPEEPFDPHVTLGEIEFNGPQADIEVSRKNLQEIIDKEIAVSGISIFWYRKRDGDEKTNLIEEITIPFL